MSDLVGNHIVGFPTRQLKCFTCLHLTGTRLCSSSSESNENESKHEKRNSEENKDSGDEWDPKMGWFCVTLFKVLRKLLLPLVDNAGNAFIPSFMQASDIFYFKAEKNLCILHG